MFRSFLPAISKQALKRISAEVRSWRLHHRTHLSEADLAGVEVVVAEVHPSLVGPAPVAGETRDLTQVRALAEHFAKLDEAGKLGALFAPAKSTAADVIVDAQHEEGWILGA